MSGELYDVIVIGGGIAGSSAALYTARQGLKTVIVSIDVGGQLKYASIIENYPGIESIEGLDLALRVQKQAASYGADIIIDEVASISKNGGIFVVRTVKGVVLKSLSVIAACGKAPRKLGVEGEEKFVGRGLSYCSLCDGPLYRGRRIALNSFGDIGIEALHLLAPIVEELIYVVPTKADVSLQEAAKYNNVLAYPGYRVIGLHGGSRLEEITVVDGQEHREVIKVDALFVELGFEIRIDFIKPYVDVNERGEVLVDRHGATRTEGLFAAGDLVNIPYKQAVISAASGVVSALSAINYVNAKKGLSKNLVSDWRKARSSPKGLVFRL